MILAQTTTNTYDNEAGTSPLAFELFLPQALNTTNKFWWRTGEIQLITRVQWGTILAPNYPSDEKFWNPPEIKVGRINLMRDVYVQKRVRLDSANGEFLVEHPKISVRGNYNDAQMRLGLQEDVGTDHGLTVGEIGACVKVSGVVVIPPAVTTLFGAAKIGDGGFCLKSISGKKTYQELPPLGNQPLPNLSLTRADFLAFDSIQGLIYPGALCAIVTESFWMVNASSLVLPQLPPLIAGNAETLGYSYTCFEGNPTPLPGNPLCPVGELVVSPTGGILQCGITT